MALIKYTELYDGCRISTLQVKIQEEGENWLKVNPRLKKALKVAIKNVRQMARKQKFLLQKAGNFRRQTSRGVIVKQEIIPIRRAGIYMPAGRYPLLSSLYMGAIPAIEAGVKEIVVCTPPDKQGKIRPEILYLANLLSIKEIYKVGGAQAIAAMALGTETIKPVDIIVGPGNVYVNAAKKLLYGKVGIDFIAGPTELLIIADESSRADWLAADLVAQAEHDVLAKPILITFDQEFARKVKREIKNQLRLLPEAKVASEAVRKNGAIIICSNYPQAVYLANELAPEHLALYLKEPGKIIKKFHHYGCLFIGQNSAEVFGDYCAGTNHILPTNGVSRYRGGLGVADFMKSVCQVRISRKGTKPMAHVAIRLARAEGLLAHARSAELRL